jgi:hypothetical protein
MWGSGPDILSRLAIYLNSVSHYGGVLTLQPRLVVHLPNNVGTVNNATCAGKHLQDQPPDGGHCEGSAETVHTDCQAPLRMSCSSHMNFPMTLSPLKASSSVLLDLKDAWTHSDFPDL